MVRATERLEMVVGLFYTARHGRRDCNNQPLSCCKVGMAHALADIWTREIRSYRFCFGGSASDTSISTAAQMRSQGGHVADYNDRVGCCGVAFCSSRACSGSPKIIAHAS